MHQVQGLELIGQSKMLSVSDLAYGMKREVALVLTTDTSKFGGYIGGSWKEERDRRRRGFIVQQ